MKDPPLKVKEGDNVAKVKQHMEKEMLKWAMLVDEKNRFLGWITHEDLMSGKPLREVMVPPAITTAPETPLNEALSMMFNSAIGNLAVVDDYGKLLGVLTFEIIRTILAQGESENKNKIGGQVR